MNEGSEEKEEEEEEEDVEAEEEECGVEVMMIEKRGY